jgi:hypothetical protein
MKSSPRANAKSRVVSFIFLSFGPNWNVRVALKVEALGAQQRKPLAIAHDPKQVRFRQSVFGVPAGVNEGGATPLGAGKS